MASRHGPPASARGRAETPRAARRAAEEGIAIQHILYEPREAAALVDLARRGVVPQKGCTRFSCSAAMRAAIARSLAAQAKRSNPRASARFAEVEFQRREKHMAQSHWV